MAVGSNQLSLVIGPEISGGAAQPKRFVPDAEQKGAHQSKVSNIPEPVDPEGGADIWRLDGAVGVIPSCSTTWHEWHYHDTQNQLNIGGTPESLLFPLSLSSEYLA